MGFCRCSFPDFQPLQRARARRVLRPVAFLVLFCSVPGWHCLDGARPAADGTVRTPTRPHRVAVEPQTLFLAGDVMLGRGIDQILEHPGNPVLHETRARHAGRYVELAERANGSIPRGVSCDYVWGDALDILERAGPVVRIVNLETSITGSENYWKGKRIHYRMSPLNAACLSAARIDVVTLANNHAMDWGREGLEETLASLDGVGVRFVGAGLNAERAETPATIHLEGGGRLIVFGIGSPTSGIPMAWAATERRPGLRLVRALSSGEVDRIQAEVEAIERPGDVVLVSIHWGGNWGYGIPPEHVAFAHALIDKAGVDVIHGHSSHHALGIEVYRDKPILYGSGDLINDYEGIRGREEYRPGLGLMYFVTMDPASGQLVELEMAPTRVRKFRLERASRSEAVWLRDVLNREGEVLGTRVEMDKEGGLVLTWR